ncbi:hypothetical protein D3C80_1721740 [compost metagenome]
MQAVERRVIQGRLGGLDDVLQTCFQALEVHLLVLPERPRLAEFQSEGLGIELFIGKGGESDRLLALQQHRIHSRSVQARKLLA